VIADIPGLIEDCHKGKGMGIQFLRHIERTGVLAIMVEAGSEDPLGDAEVLAGELAHYSEHLAAKPKIFIMTKTDILQNGDDGGDDKNIPDGWIGISAVTGDGMDAALRAIEAALQSASGTI
jgi:GTP-binding protein